ncbi:PMS1 1 protein [Neolecta irregularis DAH-3]|uniref:PMS1 1 protein n=1 Tax=Neolecta irregularis (strain DAH-3) TaxID=1198029 RepID=A0A1U7LUS2_NEOID|nr:PMS1 1 protein [Neolecta irregularis DAH-3]|eukprot:OLL26261.1 PMS1 1 protein [Neolecta irregularis DAH-3]
MTITKLDDASVRAISSGQVITSLIDIVKELVENAVDAASTFITISLEYNGMDGITVKDNGRGIPVDDRRSMAKRYYTSKLESFEDLPSVRTYGFRGEALASIAAIAGEMSITTKTDADKVGTIYYFSREGEIISQKNVSPARGTTVTIKKIFTLFPVRRENARKQATKLPAQIKHLITTYAIVNPSIRFSSQVKGGSKLRDTVVAPTKQVTDTISQTLGKEISNSCLWVESKLSEDALSNDLRIEAFLPDPSKNVHLLNGKGYFIYIDNRPTTCLRGNLKIITKLVKQYILNSLGESTKLSDPFYYLNIVCLKGVYDPNLEPSKDAVLFRDFDTVVAKLEDLLASVYGVLERVPVISPRQKSRQSLPAETPQGTEFDNYLNRKKDESQLDINPDSTYSLELNDNKIPRGIQCSVGRSSSSSPLNIFDPSLHRESLPPHPESTAPQSDRRQSFNAYHALTSATTPSKSSPAKKPIETPWRFSMAEGENSSDSDEESEDSIIGHIEIEEDVIEDEEISASLSNPWTLAKLNNVQNRNPQHSVPLREAEVISASFVYPDPNAPLSHEPRQASPQSSRHRQRNQILVVSKPINSFFLLSDRPDNRPVTTKTEIQANPRHDSPDQALRTEGPTQVQQSTDHRQIGLRVPQTTLNQSHFQSTQNLIQNVAAGSESEQKSHQNRQKRRKITQEDGISPSKEDTSPHKNRRRSATRALGHSPLTNNEDFQPSRLEKCPLGFATHNLETEIDSAPVVSKSYVDAIHYDEDVPGNISPLNLTGLLHAKWRGKICLKGREPMSILAGYSDNGSLRALFVVACGKRQDTPGREKILTEMLLQDDLGVNGVSFFSIEDRVFSYSRIF